MAQQWDHIAPAPDDVEQPHPQDYVSYVALGIVGYDPADPTLAFVRREGGQILVEVEMMDGASVNAYLTHQQTGVNAGDYIPVQPGESVVLLMPDGDSEPYIIARCADLERQLVNQVCGIDTSTALGQMELVKQFRWMRTVDGQVFAVEAGGELLLKGGGAGVRIQGAQVVIDSGDGGVHLGADFTSAPVPGEVVGSENPVTIPGVGFIPVPDISLSLDPQPPQLRDGIARFQDPIESNEVIDPVFFAWMLAVNTVLVVAAQFLGLPWAFVDPPSRITSRLVRASRTHTSSD